jgi:hypothetical protein
VTISVRSSIDSLLVTYTFGIPSQKDYFLAYVRVIQMLKILNCFVCVEQECQVDVSMEKQRSSV